MNKRIGTALARAGEFGEQEYANESVRAFQESARFARELKQRFPQLTQDEQIAVGEALYGEACGLAMTGKATDGFAALQEAVATGFSNGIQLEYDPALDAIRALPQFEAWHKGVQSGEIAAAQAQFRKRLGEFESYPFDFILQDLDGTPVKLADFKGKVVIVHFFATWAGPCRAQVPGFVKLQTKYADQGLQVVGLDNFEVDSGEGAVKQMRTFAAQHKVNYPFLVSDEATNKQVPYLSGIPVILFIDRSGKVRMHYQGLRPNADFEAVVQTLLKEPGAQAP